MAPLFSLIRDVNPSKTQWALRLRLVRCYDVPVFRNRSQIASTECIFHDREGDRVHASLKGAAMDTIKPKLLEGHLYAVKDVIVADNRLKFKTTQCKYKLIFMKKTNVVEFYDAGFPKLMFNFRSFDELTPEREIEEFELFGMMHVLYIKFQFTINNNMMFNYVLLFADVIGKVISYQAPTQHPGTMSTRMEFRIQDSELFNNFNFFHFFQ